MQLVYQVLFESLFALINKQVEKKMGFKTLHAAFL